MNSPIDPMVGDLVALLDDNLTEMFQERAAVREHEGGYARGHAEALALLDVLNRYPEALSGVMAIAFELAGDTHWILVTDPNRGREHIARSGATRCRSSAIARVVKERFGGLAELTAAAS
ncbi:MAG: hypothetical protein K1X42_17230 [Opitutaceae bacterium]|nr:hypothetical protein [Opitutaceae bacterium]